MSWKKWIPLFLTGMFVLGAFGCRPQQPVYLGEKGNMGAHYIGDGMWPELPDTHVPSLTEVISSDAPLTLDNGTPREYWDLSLQEVVQIALQNGKVLRNLGGVSFGPTGANGAPSVLISNPYSTGTIYDPALVEADPRYGIEAALSAYDGQLSASAGWTKIDEQINPSWLYPGLNATQGDQGTFQATISKYAATGTTFYVRNSNSYDWSNNNVSSRAYPSTWSAYTEAGFTQALLQGRGVTFNRIAGPGSIPGYYNGVLIARINSERSLIDFEMGVRELVYSTENAYWNLYNAYRNFDTVKKGLKASYATWEKVRAFYDEGDIRGSAQAESQSRQQFYNFYANTKDALSNIYKTEAILRFAMGIASSDGRLIRAVDEPTVAKIRFEWNEVKSEGLSRAPELRKMKWDVKQRELELIASRNFLLPNLNFTGTYRFNGMGEDLINHSSGTTNAYRSMSGGNYQGWHMELGFSAPFGWRKERAAVRHAELNLLKYRVLLQEQELALDHNLGDVLREMARFYAQAEIAFNRRSAAQDEVSSTEQAYDIGRTTLDQVLDALRRLAEAESSYFNSIVNYNLSITKLHYLKGSLLEFNNVALAEGPWPGKAQFDAVKQARKRDAGHYINYGYTRPGVISNGVYRQFQNPQVGMTSNPMYHQGAEQMIYSDQAYMYEGGVPYQGTPYPQGMPMQYESLPGSINPTPQPNYGVPAGQYQQPYPVRSVSYQTNTGGNSAFATAAPQVIQQPVVYSVNYPTEGPAQTNPLATQRPNGYR
ncbi:MAG: TolC family protein, partial [Planctomycetaceae bacterium]|nr:TolC family protein [Planctomycetaceae bacterium]